MQCPSDGTTLLMSERQGVEIDYCPQCRGVWLDRGELDKILERAAAEADAATPRTAGPAPQRDPRGFDDRGYDRRPADPRGYDQRGYGHKKRKPMDWLGELFD